MHGRHIALSILALGVGLAGGTYAERFYLNPGETKNSDEPAILYWVAPMDPNFRKDGPGKSPMGMDLVPVYEGEEPLGDPSTVMLSAAEINAIGVRTAVARVDEISQTIESVGFVGYNEHLTSHIHTRVEGWIERLNVRAVGDRVDEGDVLFEMFSPLIGSATADHIRALESGDQRLTRASRNKLRSHGMSDRQIEEIEQSGAMARNLKVYAPQDGVVISLGAADGMYLQPNTRAVSLTELSTVWLIVDVFERDIARLTDDMTAVVEFEHLNGRIFEGRIEYIYPELEATTRTLPVRLRIDNSEGLLKPNMFGTVKLIPNETRKAVTVPTEAIIRTGGAERVVLKTGEGTFKPRLITTGLRDDFDEGGRTEVIQGLTPGEEVVASAQFLIDSESALNAGLIRMAPTDVAPARGSGELVAIDLSTRIATIKHDALESLDWPAMVSRFPIRADIPVEQLTTGQQIAFQVARGADGLLSLTDLGPVDGIAATGVGIVEAVTADGKLTISHEPIPELGWPAMRMDMPVEGIDPKDTPLDTQLEFDLSKGSDGLFVVVAIRAGSSESDTASQPESKTAEPIQVSGTIDEVDASSREATISHGPLKEIGMPGMTMDFALSDTLDPASLPIGTEMNLIFERPDGMTMVLVKVEALSPPIAVHGIINSIDFSSGMANITHGPMTEIGMPGMTMDFAVASSVAIEDLPTRVEVTLLMSRNSDLSLTLTGVESASWVGQ